MAGWRVFVKENRRILAGSAASIFVLARKGSGWALIREQFGESEVLLELEDEKTALGKFGKLAEVFDAQSCQK